MKPTAGWILALLLLAAPLPGQVDGPKAPASAEVVLAPELGVGTAVEELAAPVVDAGLAPGFVIGWADGADSGARGFGTFTADDLRVPDENTLFEIGSISKVFTAVLLAEAERRGLLRLDDPVALHLPPGVVLPESRFATIRLVDLSTHSSGLPRMPDNFRPSNEADPYADYTLADLADFLSEHELGRGPGAAYEYSNLAVGLLGSILVHVASQQEGGPQSYEELLVAWICDPLELHDTRVTLRADQPGVIWGDVDASLEARMISPHDADGAPTSRWHFDAMMSAGGIRSTVSDLRRFGRALLGAPDVVGAEASEAARALRPALLDTLMPRVILDGQTVALAWHVGGDGSVWTHSGQTGGYRSLLAVEPETERVIVSLNNGSSHWPEQVGWRLLELLEQGRTDPLTPRQPLALTESELEEYVGDYVVLPGLGFRVSREGQRLRCMLTGQPAVGIYPETRDRFFYRVVVAEITFTRDEQGRIGGLVLDQDGKQTEARRIDRESGGPDGASR